MDVANLFLRALDNRGDVYLPYEFQGEHWTKAEKETIEQAILKINAYSGLIPPKVDAMYNNWLFWKFSSKSFSARRSTWDMVGLGADSAGGLAKELDRYYSRK